MKKITIIYIVIVAALLFSCSKNDLIFKDDKVATSKYIVEVKINYSDYTGNQTKVDYNWPDGATLYIKFNDAASTSYATYSSNKKAWSITTPQGNLTKNKTTNCLVSYFEKKPSGDIIELNSNDTIYYDGSATYFFRSDTLTITANLTPKTARLRFKGESGSKIKLYGTAHYSKFNIKDCEYYGRDQELELTVNNDGYTPYIHVYFPNATKRLEITDNKNKTFIFKCSNNHLAPGASGYFDIPTEFAHGSWKMYEPTRTFKIDASDVEFKMIFVQYIEGSFYLAETETTQKLYQAIMGYNPSSYKDETKDLPVTNFYKDELDTFITSLEEKTGYPFSCPTKAQWWHAARGGNKTNNYKYSGSNDLDAVAWYRTNSYTEGISNTEWLKPVKMKSPNELGFYDMNGNVAESCLSYYENGSSSYDGAYGGSYADDADRYFILNRANLDQTYHSPGLYYIGFRLCLNL